MIKSIAESLAIHGVALVLVLALATGIVLGLDWLFWNLWLYVLQNVWPEGPAWFVRPGFWLFVGESVLLSFVLGKARS